jgi:3-oxoacyl-[acyl-carrier protein] reductase
MSHERRTVALITAARGLGKSIALAMAGEAPTLSFAINETALPDAAKEIEAVGGKCLGVRCAVSEPKRWRYVRADCHRFGTLSL